MSRRRPRGGSGSRRVFALLATCLGVLAACAAPSTPRASPPPEAGATPTLRPTHTPRPTASATPSPTATPTRPAFPTVPAPAPAPSRAAGPGLLAFVRQGDLWLLDLASTDPPRPLTSLGDVDTPRWSPSGRWLAFRRQDGELWLVDVTGASPSPLADGLPVTAFAWSPRRDTLAYVVEGRELWLIDAGSLTPRRLLRAAEVGPQATLGRMVWNPVNEWLIVATMTDTLWMASPDGQVRAPLCCFELPEAGGLMVPMTWTGDGAWLALQLLPPSASLTADGAPLYAVNPARGTVRPVDTMLAFPDFVAAAPGGTDLLAAVLGGGRETWMNKRLQVRALAPDEARWSSPPDLAAGEPAWSPEGARLAFAAVPDQSEAGFMLQGEMLREVLLQRRIWVAQLETGTLEQATAEMGYEEAAPRWTGDGRSLVFLRIDRQGRASLWLLDLDGRGGARRLTEVSPFEGPFGYYGHVDWGATFDLWPGSWGP